MNTIFKKLNYKDQKEILVINAPSSFDKEMDEMKSYAIVKTKATGTKAVEFALAFAIKQQDVDSAAKLVAPLIQGDVILWFAYPKGSSKKYKCEFNRDNGWAVLGKLGFEPVRMVAIDEDWSALRFRKTSHIKTMTRSSAISDAGKKRIAEPKKKKP
ncbi:MAG: hypothetical protein ABIS36_11840 [Chryseolinea sp.]